MKFGLEPTQQEKIEMQQETGIKTDLNVPECLAITAKTQQYAIDVVMKLPIEQQQEVLDFVEQCHDEGIRGERDKIQNPIAFLVTCCKAAS
jgi:hypothetical protein